MPRGHPDWGRETGTPRVEPQAEDMLARLGQGLEALHYSGRLLFQTSFASGGLGELVWQNIVGVGGQLANDATKGEFGTRSIKITHGNGVGNVTQFARGLGIGHANRFGHEISVLIPSAFTRGNLAISVQMHDGQGGERFFQVFLDWSPDATYGALGKLRYTNSSGVETDVPGGSVGGMAVDRTWNQLKLVADNSNPNSPLIDSIIFNGVEYPVAAAPQDIALVPTYPGKHVEFGIHLNAKVASNQFLYIGSWIETSDEP